MSDRELLEAAAKAAGLYVCADLDYLGLKVWGDELWVKEDKFGNYRQWNPLANDGDAFRLSADLKISVEISGNEDEFFEVTCGSVWESFFQDYDASKAMRRAIVRCAAKDFMT